MNLTYTESLQLRRIHDLLDEAYQHYFSGSAGHCKSHEGNVEVSFGNYWDRNDREDESASWINSVSVWSYALGPHRRHDFDSMADALEAVKEWYATEMSTVYCKKCRTVLDVDGCACKFYERAGK